MSRFVMVSFIVMGWSFYELSGGSDFTPPEKPAPSLVATAEPAASTKRAVTALSLVTQPVLRPAQQTSLLFNDNKIAAAAIKRPVANPGLRGEIALTQIATIGSSLEFGLQVNAQPSNDNTMQLASLSAGLTSLTGNQVIPDVAIEPIIPQVNLQAQAIDLRHVTATRVNMRNGPGTIYPVVTKLSQDASVEVLDDSGTGWLRLRVVADETTGWIAASLISKKRP